MPFWRRRNSTAQEESATPEPPYTVESEPIPGLDLLFEELDRKWEEEAEVRNLQDARIRSLVDSLYELEGRPVKVTNVKKLHNPEKTDNPPRTVSGTLQKIGYGVQGVQISLSATSDGLSATKGYSTFTYTATADSRLCAITTIVPEETEEVEEFVVLLEAVSEYSEEFRARADGKRASAVTEQKLERKVRELVGEYVVLENVDVYNRMYSGKMPETAVVGRLLEEGRDPTVNVDKSTQTGSSRFAIARWDGINVFCHRTPQTRIRRVTRLELKEPEQASA